MARSGKPENDETRGPSPQDKKGPANEPKKQLDCVDEDAAESACELANAEEAERERGSNAT